MTPPPRVLAVDAGNTAVKAAVWDGAWGPVHCWPTDDASAAAWAGRLAALDPAADRAGLASVVPRVTTPLADALAAHAGRPATVVSTALPLPVRMAYRTPATLGADRLAAAVAAHALAGGRAVVALDAGTAVTLDAVSAEPAYLGGAILPGPDLLRRALARDTGQLPEVEWALPSSPVGASTDEAIRSGLTGLLVGGVADLLDRTVAVLGGDALVVATGGWGPWLAEQIDRIDRVDPHLVLDGVRLLTDRAASGERR